MRSKLAYSIVMLFVSPAIVAINGIRSKNATYQKWILILFVTFFGSVITLSTSDGAIHLGRVYEYYLDLSWRDFWVNTFQILQFKSVEGTKGDLYIHILSYFTGGILGFPPLFFVLVSFVYGYFYVSSLLLILKRYQPQAKYLIYLLGVVLVMWKGLEGINTVRTWTGAWILFYSFWKFSETKNKKYLLLIACTPFIHFGYFVMSLPVWGVLLIGPRPILYTIVFAMSFFTSLNADFVTRNISVTEVGENRVAGYYQEGPTNVYGTGKGGGNFYIRYGKRGLNFVSINLLAFLIIPFFYLQKNSMRFELERKVFSAGLMLITLANLMTFIPALFNRTMTNAGIFILAAAILVIAKNSFWGFPRWRPLILKIGIVASLLLFFPFLLFRLSGFLQFCSAYMLALPFIPWFIEDANMSLRELITFFL